MTWCKLQGRSRVPDEGKHNRVFSRGLCWCELNGVIYHSVSWRCNNIKLFLHQRKTGCSQNAFRVINKSRWNTNHGTLVRISDIVTGGFPTQKASNRESRSMPWRHHAHIELALCREQSVRMKHSYSPRPIYKPVWIFNKNITAHDIHRYFHQMYKYIISSNRRWSSQVVIWVTNYVISVTDSWMFPPPPKLAACHEIQCFSSFYPSL